MVTYQITERIWVSGYSQILLFGSLYILPNVEKHIGVSFTRRNLFLGLVIAIIISDSIIFFAEIKSKELYSNWIISINATIAATLAILVIYRIKTQQHHHEHNTKAHIALAIGLSLWLCADIIWAIYQIILEIVPPVPSIADFLWLTAYCFLAYYLYATYGEFHKKFRFNKRVVFFSIIGSAIFLGYIISVTLSLSTLTTPRGIVMFTVIVAYPILDAILMIPAISILVNFKNEPLWFTPWICESLGIFLMAVSDSWFALVVLTSLLEQYWLSALFFAAHYLVIAAGLVWYIKFLLAVPADSNSRRLSTEVTISTDNIRKSIFSINKRRLLPFYRKEKRVRYITIAALATIIIITTAGIVNYYYYSSYLPYPFLSFLSFANNNANSEIILPAPVGSKNVVTIGALLPLTGTLSSVGESEEAALDIAVKDINENFSKNHSSIQISVVVEDTQTNPSVSLEKLKYLVGKGIRIIIGPATSADLQATQDYANSNGVLLLSPSSTAPSLAIPGNNVFRFVPDDTHQAQAISKLMWNDGIRVVIPLWRTDVYGNDLVNAVKQNFQQLGGRVLQGVGYTPNTGDFFASLNRINFIVWDQDLRSLSSKLNEAISKYGTDKVAIYLVAFDEVAPIFVQSQSHPILSTVKWYGSDGSALNNKLIRNPEAALFAIKTSFPTPIYAVENDSNDKFRHFEAQIHKKIERTPRSYASVAYDVLWIAALTEVNAKNVHDTNYLKNTLVKIANSYKGITGNTSLNQAGDRKYGDYDFWAIRNIDNTHGTFAWKVVSKYLFVEIKNKQRLMPEIISTR